MSAPVKQLEKAAPGKASKYRTTVQRGALALVLCLVVGGAAWAGLGETLMSSREPAVKKIPLVVTSTPIAAEPWIAEPAKKPVRKEPVPLTVESEPWAMLYLDNVELGATPVLDIQVLPGKHRIRLEQEGYLTKIETIMVTGSGPIKRKYNLEPAGPP